jgi:mRNA-degrading endonuclease toxin of MazEF toxin-antitoxin module
LTSQEPVAGYPLTHEIRSVRLAKRSWVETSRIRVLSVERLSNKLGRLEAEGLDHILDGLDEIIR